MSQTASDAGCRAILDAKGFRLEDVVKSLVMPPETEPSGDVESKDLRGFADRLHVQMKFNTTLLRELRVLQEQQQALETGAREHAAEVERAREGERIAQTQLGMLEERIETHAEHKRVLTKKLWVERQAREDAEQQLACSNKEVRMRAKCTEEERAKRRSVGEALQKVQAEKCRALNSLEELRRELKTKEKERGELVARCDELEAQNRSLADSQKQVCNKVDRVRAKASDAQDLLSQERRRCSLLEHQVEDMSKQRRDLDGSCAKLKRALREQHDEVQRMRTSLSDTKEAFKQQSSKLEERDRVLESQTRELGKLQMENRALRSAMDARMIVEETHAPAQRAAVVAPWTPPLRQHMSGGLEDGNVTARSTLESRILEEEERYSRLQNECTKLLSLVQAKDDELLELERTAADEAQLLRKQFEKLIAEKEAELQAVRNECEISQKNAASLCQEKQQVMQDRLRLRSAFSGALRRLGEEAQSLFQEFRAFREEHRIIVDTFSESKAAQEADKERQRESIAVLGEEASMCLTALCQMVVQLREQNAHLVTTKSKQEAKAKEFERKSTELEEALCELRKGWGPIEEGHEATVLQLQKALSEAREDWKKAVSSLFESQERLKASKDYAEQLSEVNQDLRKKIRDVRDVNREAEQSQRRKEAQHTQALAKEQAKQQEMMRQNLELRRQWDAITVEVERKEDLLQRLRADLEQKDAELRITSRARRSDIARLQNDCDMLNEQVREACETLQSRPQGGGLR